MTDDGMGLSDVDLLGQDSGMVLASRFILSARSPVFQRMLNRHFRKANASTISCNLGSDALSVLVDFC